MLAKPDITYLECIFPTFIDLIYTIYFIILYDTAIINQTYDTCKIIRASARETGGAAAILFFNPDILENYTGRNKDSQSVRETGKRTSTV